MCWLVAGLSLLSLTVTDVSLHSFTVGCTGVAQVLHSWFSAQLLAAGCLCTVSVFLLLLAAPHYWPQPVKTSDCGRTLNVNSNSVFLGLAVQ